MPRLESILTVVEGAEKVLTRYVRGFRSALGRQLAGTKQAYPAPNVDAVSGELKISYGRSHVTLLPIDPYHVHAYWEVTARDGAAARKRLDPALDREILWVLRFYDVKASDRSRDANVHFFDVPIKLNARKWYIDLWSADREYVVELGLRVDGTFLAICRSNIVRLPRADCPPPGPRTWAVRRQGSDVDAATQEAGELEPGSGWTRLAAEEVAEPAAPVPAEGRPVPVVPELAATEHAAQRCGSVIPAHEAPAQAGPFASGPPAVAWRPVASTSSPLALSTDTPHTEKRTGGDLGARMPSGAEKSRSVSLNDAPSSSPGGLWQHHQRAAGSGGHRR